MSISCSKGTSFGYLSSYLLVILKVYCFFYFILFFLKKKVDEISCVCIFVCIVCVCMCVYIYYI